MNVNFVTCTKSEYNSMVKDPDTFYKVIEERNGGLYDQNNELVYSWQELIDNNLISIIDNGVWKGSDSDRVAKLDGKLVIAEGITHTRLGAFEDCVNLTDVITPHSLVSIAQDTFQECTGLRKIQLNDGVEAIGARAFFNCTSLEEINFPESLTEIYTGAFNYCSSLVSIEINHLLDLVQDNTFGYCESLETVKFVGATTFGRYNFTNCTSLTSFNSDVTGQAIIDTNTEGVELSGSLITSLIYREGVTTASKVASCKELVSVQLPNSLITIPNSTFYHCENLESITLPSNITTIGNQAFEGCYALTSIELPNTVQSIGSSAFQSCEELTYAVIPDTITSLGAGTFVSCYKLARLNSNVAGEGNLPSALTSIGNRCFAWNRAFNNINIPNGVTTIAEYAFADVNHITYHGSASGSPWGAKGRN